MRTLPLAGTASSVSFFDDDTIDTVRQQVALATRSHPDRLFIEARTVLPKDYYSTNPKHWMELFFRLSYDGKTIKSDTMTTYTTQTRLNTNVRGRDITKEEWETQPLPEDLHSLMNPDSNFDEWCIFGVTEGRSFVMPLPPRDLVELKPANIPLPKVQSLFESVHPYEITELRATEIADDPSAAVMRNYFPFFRATTPSNIENLRPSIQSNQQQLRKLLDLDATKHSSVSILRAKWFIPLVSTEFKAPRTRFEQIFYGMTVSKETPYIGYYTSKQEVTRHKFYVENPKDKKPFVDIAMWKAWLANTQPQRKLPTLLLYRGTSRTSFDRIAITSKDITLSTVRPKDSKETMEELKTQLNEWLQTFDALIPFMQGTDIALNRWELNDMSVVASYKKAIDEFDMRRFPCLQTIFSFQDGAFRLLRADHSSENISNVELQAYQIMQQSDSVSSTVLEDELGLSPTEAADLFKKIVDLGEDFDVEKAMKEYPIIKFSSTEVIISSVTALDRVLQYSDILRFVLTSDSESLDSVCPRRMELVESSAAVPQERVSVGEEFDLGDDLMAAFADLDIVEPTIPKEKPKESKKVRVQTEGALGTNSYFINRLHRFDPEMFDKSYPKKCEKLRQVVVLTPEDQERIPEDFSHTKIEENETLPLDGGIAICPSFWCMYDEIPLRSDQLEIDEDGQMHCPVCKGMVRVTNKEDPKKYTVIKREKDLKFPDYKKVKGEQKKIPCCYQTPRSTVEILAPREESSDEYYVLSAAVIPGLRMAYIPDDLASQLNIKTAYTTSMKEKRIRSGGTDMFRVGMGLPRKSLPVLLKSKTTIPRPRDAVEKVEQCSFFRTWKDVKGEGSNRERIINGIDYAFENKTLSTIDEIEYVTSILDCKVMRINTAQKTMQCGFWSDKLGPSARTIVLLDTDVLGKVTRRISKAISKFDYVVNIYDFAKETRDLLLQLHKEACSSTIPSYDDAIQELRTTGKTSYEIIHDPFGRAQAIFIPHEVILPIHPVNMKTPEGVHVRSGYSEIDEGELPTSEVLGEFLKNTKNAGFKWKDDIYDARGRYVEFALESGFRVPFQPEDSNAPEPVREIMETMRTHPESDLVDGAPNAEDLKMAQHISYSAEVYEFMLYSLSKDIQDEEYSWLRKAIKTPNAQFYTNLKKWMDAEAHWDTVKEPNAFVHKVRKPCGQYKEKDSCASSSLCGWHKSVCKMKISSIVDKKKILTRLTKTLIENEKQRALVLDGRLSPFFSTILYLEMPHEWITTKI